MKMSCEFCGVRTSSFGLDMRDLLKLVPRLEVSVALKFAFEADRRNIPSMGDRPVLSPRRRHARLQQHDNCVPDDDAGKSSKLALPHLNREALGTRRKDGATPPQ